MIDEGSLQRNRLACVVCRSGACRPNSVDRMRYISQQVLHTSVSIMAAEQYGIVYHTSVLIIEFGQIRTAHLNL